MRPGLKLAFGILCAVPFIMVLGNSMLIPLLPVIKSKLGVSMFQAGLLITAFSLPAGIVIPFAGFLSDYFGRKPVMAPALFIYGLGGLLAGLSAYLISSPYLFILGSRILQGIGAGGTYQLAMALTGDIFQSSERTRTLGLLETSNGLGKVVSPIAGAALGSVVWFIPFFAYGLLAIPLSLAIWIVVREPARPKDRTALRTYVRNLGQVFRNKGLPLAASVFAGMIVLLVLFGVLSYVSDILEAHHGVTGIRLGLLIAIPVGYMALTSYLSGNYLEKKEGNLLKTVITAGLASVTVALISMALSADIYLLFVAASMIGIGTGVVLPAVNTLVTSASAKERGGITCLYGSSRFIGVALGPPVFGLVTTIGRLPLFLGFAALAAAIALLAGIFIKADQLLPPEMLPQTN